MLFMVIETFRNQDALAAYERFRDRGRLLPGGVTFVGSWVTADLKRCFQVMESDSAALIQQWVSDWADLIEFEVLPVTSGKETAEALAGRLPAAKEK